jgi:hypothetical protein
MGSEKKNKKLTHPEIEWEEVLLLMKEKYDNNAIII